MKIYSSVTFGKTLVGQCDLRRENHKKVPCNIFQLNYHEDKDYFLKLEKSRPWQNAWFMWDMDSEFNSDVTGERTYVMESKGGRCLGYIAMLTDYDDQKEEEIVYLETCPKYQTKNSNRTLKYIGETLISFIIGTLDKKKTEAVIIKAYSETGKPFYINNCGFEECEERNNSLLLKNKDFKKLSSKNEKHIKSKIQYFG